MIVVVRELGGWIVSCCGFIGGLVVLEAGPVMTGVVDAGAID